MSEIPADKSGPTLHVAPGPHIASDKLTTRRMMIDVLIGLAPVTVVALVVFQLYAALQLAICVGGCVLAEVIFTKMRRKPLSIGDFSAVVTGMILAYSMPGPAAFKPHVGLIAAFMAIGLGKVVFGGVGQNIFNPAMVGRAFVMIAFPGLMAAGGYVAADSTVAAVTGATPMTRFYQMGEVTPLWELVLGNTNGSLGETSGLALLIGGLYLCVRRTASWEIPVGAIVGLGAFAGLMNLTNPMAHWTVLHHLFGGAFLLGAFFIMTDPVSSPLTPKGKWIFGILFGVLVMFLREFSAYPEGVMFSVLVMNSLVPLINRWTVPRPVGGPVPAPQKKD